MSDFESPFRVEKAREAPVHFELYRHIKNYIESAGKSGLTKYLEVIPEKDVPGIGTADLVIEDRASEAILLVIEVKKKTPLSILVFDDASQEQAYAYASKLGALFYAVSDGDALRLFRNGSTKPLGEYAISLNEDFVKNFLEGLSRLYLGKSQSLPFPLIEPPFAKIRQMASSLGRTFLHIFDDLSGKDGIRLEQHGHVAHLYVGKVGSILRLGLYAAEDKTEDFIDVRLELLRGVLKDRFAEAITDLAHVSAFGWIKEGNWEKESNKYRNLKSIAALHPDLDQTAKDLTAWLTKLQEEPPTAV
jgi:hypothetical protein